MVCRALLFPVLAAVLLGGCGSAGPAVPPSAPAAASTPAPDAHHSSGGLELWAVQSGPLGVVVTDGAGRLLYRHDRDSATPPTSACVGPCAAVWEPVLKSAQPPVLLGVDATALGTLTRPDGTVQYTLGGWPVYLRAGEPGGLADAGSSGTDGVWHAVRPDGSRAAAS